MRGNPKKRLEEIQGELARDREALRIADEQLAFQQGVADDAKTSAVVEATPLAGREHREADGDLQRLRRQAEDLRDRIAMLRAEQDQLLEQMFEEAGG
jgi:chromosome segregation ATPase